jgi:hypothetical protein
MFAKIRGRLGVAILAAVIAVILNLTLLACASTTWTGAATGAADSQGTAGPAAGLQVQVVHAALRIMPQHRGTVTATCPAGTVLTGGGFDAAGDENISQSYPNWPDFQGWTVTGFNTDSNLDSQGSDVVAYAVCTRVSQ